MGWPQAPAGSPVPLSDGPHCPAAEALKLAAPGMLMMHTLLYEAPVHSKLAYPVQAELQPPPWCPVRPLGCLQWLVCQHQLGATLLGCWQLFAALLLPCFSKWLSAADDCHL